MSSAVFGNPVATPPVRIACHLRAGAGSPRHLVVRRGCLLHVLGGMALGAALPGAQRLVTAALLLACKLIRRVYSAIR
jgi:hypothetical protein